MISNIAFGKNVIIFGVDNSSLIHVNNKKKVFLNFGKGSTQGLEDPTITPEKLIISPILLSQKKRFV